MTIYDLQMMYWGILTLMNLHRSKSYLVLPKTNSSLLNKNP